MKTYTLMTPKRRASVYRYLAELNPLSGPIKAIKHVGRIFSHQDLIAAQRKTLRTAIKEGKANGVKEMECTFDQALGLSGKGYYNGANYECTLGSGGKMHVRIKYR